MVSRARSLCIAVAVGSCLAVALGACVVAPPPTAPAPTGPPPPRVAPINDGPGAMVDIERHLVPGYVTVVDFWAEWCAACKTIEAELMVGLAGEPSVVLRKVDVGAGDSDVARAYRLGGLPHLRIFDRYRRLRYVLVGNDAHGAARAALALAREP